MSAVPPVELLVLDDAAAMARAAADCLAEAAWSALAARGRFDVALAGGGTPQAAYRLLAAGRGARTEWPRVHVWFGDERCVPPDHAASNYAAARDALLAHVPIPEAQVHRVAGERGPEAAADAYDRELRDAFGEPGATLRTFDLVLLGVGEDGHTASLFPGGAALAVRERWAVAADSPDPERPWPRVTLTLPAIRAADTVLVLAAGAGKRRVARAVLDGDAAGRELPAGRAHGRRRTLWLVDAAAWLSPP